MADLDDVNDAIAESASGPKRLRHGNREIEQHDPEQQVKAAQHLAGEQAKTKPGFGVRFQKIRPYYE